MESQKIESVNCNHCGATLEVDEQTQFVTCSYCHSRLAVQRTGAAVFTKELEKIEAQTEQIAGNLKVITLQNELDQLQREWSDTRAGLAIGDGRQGKTTPSTLGGIVTIIIAVVVGGAWTLLAANIHAPVPMVLFGFVFIAVGVASGIFSLKKAAQLETERTDYQSRKQKLMEAIEAAKRPQ